MERFAQQPAFHGAMPELARVRAARPPSMADPAGSAVAERVLRMRGRCMFCLAGMECVLESCFCFAFSDAHPFDTPRSSHFSKSSIL